MMPFAAICHYAQAFLHTRTNNGFLTMFCSLTICSQSMSPECQECQNVHARGLQITQFPTKKTGITCIVFHSFPHNTSPNGMQNQPSHHRGPAMRTLVYGFRSASPGRTTWGEAWTPALPNKKGLKVSLLNEILWILMGHPVYPFLSVLPHEPLGINFGYSCYPNKNAVWATIVCIFYNILYIYAVYATYTCALCCYDIHMYRY